MRGSDPNNDNPRCPICGPHLALCLCDTLTSHSTRTRFRFLQHTQEQLKPTNSARLACHILEQAEIIPWERKGAFPVPHGSILLYPSADAIPLAPEELVAPVTIAIADGTWGQASKIASLVGQGPVHKRSLPLGNRSAWTIRHCADPERISSAQAAAMVLHLAGEYAAAESVMRALTESAKRILSMRGIVRHPPKQSMATFRPPPPNPPRQ